MTAAMMRYNDPQVDHDDRFCSSGLVVLEQINEKQENRQKLLSAVFLAQDYPWGGTICKQQAIANMSMAYSKCSLNEALVEAENNRNEIS